ncbi:MAG: hypothetical protein CBD58_00105 [bacterium TMED198]|nr:MAG: hypothetical protein CBD58_00105 [bacterium TMED198]
MKLGDIANTRSGDKGSDANIGVIFHTLKHYEWAKKYLSESIIKDYFSEIIKGDVIRYELDNILALNFILCDCLDGGGSKSLMHDAQGKTLGQALSMMELDING